ncbi:hypothetical protein O6H91_18G078900 [Diphasiastrum complanatum]|uniref:Uncharacterized protein n=1 Tax=Diphasiastrum complanatum TaxID=34168 RepID=A0ACC2B2W1_DIPCM|nr:hypothetical protein O6H91_18G078900 [Diphasiastrum complanatum]
MGDLKTNKTTTLHDNTICSSVVSLTCSLDGSTCLVGHLDGSIYRFKIDNSSEGVMSTHFFTHGCVPLVLAWGKSIVAAGSDGKRKRKGFCSGCFSPDGETVIIGHFNGFHMYRFIFQDRSWQDVCEKKVENLYTVSSVAWNLDGSQVAVGTLCGRVDVFDAALCRQKYLGKFELTYITKSKLIIRRLPLGVKFTINTAAVSEIIKINIYNDQYLIAHTSETLLLGNLESCKISEVHWHGRGNEKFIIDDPLVCGIYSVGELYLVEYGCNKILGTCQTIFLSPFLISLRVNNLQSTLIDARQVGNKKVAYLADLKTIRVLDLVSGVTAATITHDCNVDWIQLDQQSRYLLFRDKKQQLHLLNVASQEHRLLLDTCTFLGWVPHSNVVVAQVLSDYDFKIFAR